MELPIHHFLERKNLLHRESRPISLLGFILDRCSLEAAHLLFPKIGERKETGMPGDQRHSCVVSKAHGKSRVTAVCVPAASLFHGTSDRMAKTTIPLICQGRAVVLPAHKWALMTRGTGGERLSL